jgi:23S rRNA (guanine2445-N2)-methyltransferase / 23S rRNA (guanine2069-N7)-methyltransferase
VILGYDSDSASIRAAMVNLRKAGLEKYVHVERQAIETLKMPPSVQGIPGLIMINPPYGERMGQKGSLEMLYSKIGECLRSEFTGWKAAVFTGNPELGKVMGIRAVKTNNLYNGNIKSRLLHFDIREEYFTREVLKRTDGKTADEKAEEESRMFANRLRKNLRSLGRWAESKDISCYRLYDADVPEFNVAVDLYGDQVHVQEYEAPPGIDPEYAAARLRAVADRLREILNIPEDRIHLKIRRRQRGRSQYDRHSDSGRFIQVREGGLLFYVNLTDYLDTGLFLDHRKTREMIRGMSAASNFLNLFSYTGSATVYAADGGADSTTSVDMSRTYLNWARRNMLLNGLTGSGHRFYRADILSWIKGHEGRYGLIFLDPPTYSRSSAMKGDFDIQRDHVTLLRDTVRLLAPDGTLIFSTSRRRFDLDKSALRDLEINDITSETVPRDFEKSKWVHKCFKIMNIRR